MELNKLKQRLDKLVTKLNLAEIKNQVKKLETKTITSDFWKNEARAKKINQQLSFLQKQLTEIDSLQKLFDDLQAATELNLAPEITKLEKQFLKKLDRLETQTFLSGSYDANEAILSIHPGQGGTEACDWASMLQRMYSRFFDQQNWPYELVAFQPGEEAGIKKATYIVHQPYAYGYLKHEQGTHRLVRQSPFNADNLRQTSFSLVEVMPILDSQSDIQLKPEEIEFHAFRSSGAGGQNVNKVSTAVRIKHLPTGIIVECQTQRSQQQNRATAEKLLLAKLWERQEKARQQKLASIKGQHQTASWGTQIRSYVLHPYKLIKDLRTNLESNQPQKVLDGDLDSFIQAELRQLSSS